MNYTYTYVVPQNVFFYDFMYFVKVSSLMNQSCPGCPVTAQQTLDSAPLSSACFVFARQFYS